ncbi:MAG: hypothetical protein ACE5DX_06105 [Candidatus Dojkabacteria bacterium]
MNRQSLQRTRTTVQLILNGSESHDTEVVLYTGMTAGKDIPKGVIDSGETLRRVLGELGYQCPVIDLKRHLAILIPSRDSQCVRMSVDALVFKKGLFQDAIVTRYMKAGQPTGAFALVSLDKSAVETISVAE